MKTVVLCGHNKCGTRWLARSIKNIDGVQFIDQKKIRQYFQEGDVKFRKRLFGPNDSIYIDWPYCIQNSHALDFLTKVDEQMEAMIIYREPVDAMLSFHRYQRGAYRNGYLLVAGQKLPIYKKITDANLHEQLKSGLLRHQFEILFQYDKNLTVAKKHFIKVHEFLYEDLLIDNASSIKRICNILGCDCPKATQNGKVNVGMKVKSEFMHHLICKIMLTLSGLDTKHLVSAFAEGRLKKSLAYYLLRLNWSDAPLLNSYEISDLKRSYADMVRRFEKLTSCDLEVWGKEYNSTGTGMRKNKQGFGR